MRSVFIEATDGQFWGKFLVGIFESRDWAGESRLSNRSILVEEGWREPVFFLLDVSNPGNGSLYQQHQSGVATHDQEQKNTQVCYLYADVLHWLYQQDLGKTEEWPGLLIYRPQLTRGLRELESTMP